MPSFDLARLAPGRLGRGLGRRLLTGFSAMGDRVECCLCGWRGRFFLPGGLTIKRPGRKCPRCGSIERYRQLCVYLRERTDWLTRPARVLDLAPPPYFQAFCRRQANWRYLTADLMSPVVQIHTDITALSFGDRTFDLVFCFHVLEHVRADLAGMRELKRVVAPGGLALIQVPLRGTTTEEDPDLDPSRYEECYGQSDHVRYYGLDLRERLVSAGFDVRVIEVPEEFPAEDVARYGLAGEDRYIFACRPAPASNGESS